MHVHFAYATVLSIVISCVSFSAIADTRDIETITVSATPIQLDEAGSSVTIITKDELQKRNAATLLSILREVPGFAVSQAGSFGSAAQVRVRGAEANQVLVLINGNEANDISQGSEFDFSQMSTNDIERIEIVRGAQSALWGSDALAGVINIITSPSATDSSATASLEGGSFGSARGTLSGEHVSDRNQVKMSLDYIDTSGENISRIGNEEDGFDSLTASLAGKFVANDTFNVGYTLRYTQKTTEFDAIDFFTTGLPVDADHTTDSKYLYSGIKLSHTINETIDHALRLTRTDTENETDTGGVSNDLTAGVKDAIHYQINLIGAEHRLSVLAEYEKEEFTQRGAASFFGDPNQDRGIETDSIAAEYRYDLDNFNLSLSTRYDDNSDFDSANSWRLTLNRQFGETNVFAAIGESVKNPTFTERFGFFTNFVGNRDLKPEQSLHWEVGARRTMLDDQLSSSITVFSADLENEINGFVFDSTTGGFTSANVEGDSTREGVELQMKYAPGARFDVQASYTYLNASQEDLGGKDMTEVRRPEHSGSVAFNYYWDRAGINLVVSYTGEQEDDFFPPFPPFQERVALDSFTLVSLGARYNLTDRLTLTGRVENLADEDYEQVYGFQSPGVSAYLGIRVSW
jgi:vitamin B12 transporter